MLSSLFSSSSSSAVPRRLALTAAIPRPGGASSVSVGVGVGVVAGRRGLAAVATVVDLPRVVERRPDETGRGGRASDAGVKVCVFGATGFLGRYVCSGLGEFCVVVFALRARARVRVFFVVVFFGSLFF